jgi:hypothetical protein
MVSDGENLDAVLGDEEKDAVRKSVNRRPMDVSMHAGIDPRARLDAFKARVNRRDELPSQTHLPLLVPLGSELDFRLDVGPED